MEGAAVIGFGGFFDKEFRNYDYYVGRTKAIDFLKELQEKNSQGKRSANFICSILNLGKFTKASGRFRDVDLDKVDRKLQNRSKSAFGTIGEDP